MGSEQLIAAIDQGTTGTRCIIFDKQGRQRATAYEEHRQIYPQPGWVEHDAAEIWAKTVRVTRAALAQAGLTPRDLAGLGITNQRETAVVWDAQTGAPLANAIVWQDTRTLAQCQALIDGGYEPLIRERTGLVVATYFSGPKLAWLLDSVPGLRARAEQGQALFGTIDSWLIWNLTGGPQGGAHVTDVTNASRTLLMNLHTLQWDDDLLHLLNIPRQMLPEIRPSSDPRGYGRTPAGGPLGGEVLVCGAAGDQQAALAGQTCFAPGEAKNTYGTGCFLLLNTGETPVASQRGLLTTVACGLQPGNCTYALEGSIAITGAAVQWLRDNLGLIKNAAETEEIAATVADAGGAYFVPAFSGLFAPHWDMYARGAIVGLTRYVTRAHLVRATLEAVCYQSREVLEAMEADTGLKLSALKVDGGAVANNLLMQMQADILGTQVIRPTVRETTALGAAYMAGLATGVWQSTEDLRLNWGIDRTFEPAWSGEQRAAGYHGWQKAVQRARGWVEKDA
ncbi:MAG TPA: glycerol kinase GlpK [Anaerolineae bacterium]|nr:glycerol kinase GlpK [Anaerolineae bacterium]HPL26740.1 glycerol kinase GlpK [Anaerolineae bacterium]